MAETLTRGEAQVVVTDLKKELEDIRNRIKTGGFVTTAVEELKKRQDKIQNKLNEILKKGGLITEEDFNEAYELIKRKEQKELLDLNLRRKNTMLVLGLIVGGVIIFYLIKKQKNK